MSQPAHHHFFWVEFVRECGPKCPLDLVVPEIFWLKNRQSASETIPVKVSYHQVVA